jgi:cell division protein FtsZ
MKFLASARQIMNRRQFNQTVFAIGAIAALPALAYPTAAAVQPLLKSELDNGLIRIGLIAVGGSDGNTVASMARGLSYVTRAIAIDTDAAALNSAGADRVVLIGSGIDKPQHPRQAFEMARRQAHEIEADIGDLDLVFIIAGMYGAAGKGMAPVVADIARRKRITALGIAITPAEWQGAQSNPRVRYGIQEFQRAGATVFPIESYHMAQALGEEGSGVSQTVRSLFASISHAINGYIVGINLVDLPLVLAPGGIAAMGFGSAEGVNRAENALQRAIAHPLLGMDRLLNATGVLINVRGNAGLQFSEADKVWRPIRRMLPLDPALLYSGSVDESVGDKLIVSIVATVPEAANRPII